MANSTAIANEALDLISHDTINSLDGSSTIEKKTKEHFDAVLSMMLETHPWFWAERRRLLVPATSEDPYFAYAWDRPGSCAAVRRVMMADAVNPENAIVPFRSLEQKIYTNTAGSARGLAVWFTVKGIEPGHWPQTFADFMAIELAFRLKFRFRAAWRRDVDPEKMYERRQNAAKAFDMNQAGPYRPFDSISSFEKARDG